MFNSKRPGCISRVAGRQLLPILLAAAGVGSHNRCEQLVADGRVTLNGQVVYDPRTRADPLRDVLAVDGHPVRLDNFCRYIAFHKPYQVLSSFTDREGRSTVADYVPIPDVYAAGRLDYDSEGLLFLTNDNWLLHRLTHPRYDHPKTYLVQVEGVPDEQALAQLARGVLVKGERTKQAEVELLVGDKEPQIPPRSVPIRYRASIPTSWLRVVLREGRKRQLRHMTAAVGYPTLRLIRTAIGPIRLNGLASGEWRDLTDEELRALARMLR